MSEKIQSEKPKRDAVQEKIDAVIREDRERIRIFLNGFFCGVLFVLWLTQLVRGISESEG